MNREKLQDAGVDLKKGLRNFSGNQLIYNRFLMSYTTDSHLENCKKVYKEKDDVQLEEQLQALQRLVGKLGMEDFAGQCQQAIDALQAGEGQGVSDTLEEMQTTHEKVIAALKF